MINNFKYFNILIDIQKVVKPGTEQITVRIDYNQLGI